MRDDLTERLGRSSGDDVGAELAVDVSASESETSAGVRFSGAHVVPLRGSDPSMRSGP